MKGQCLHWNASTILRTSIGAEASIPFGTSAKSKGGSASARDLTVSLSEAGREWCFRRWSTILRGRRAVWQIRHTGSFRGW